MKVHPRLQKRLDGRQVRLEHEAAIAIAAFDETDAVVDLDAGVVERGVDLAGAVAGDTVTFGSTISGGGP